MGHVIHGARKIGLLQPHEKIKRPENIPGFHLTGHDYAHVNGKRRRLHLSSTSKKRIEQIGTDLAVVCEHFGLSMTEALTVALHLTANAIRAGKAVPSVRHA